MKRNPSTKTDKTRQAGRGASPRTEPAGLLTPVQTRFVIQLPDLESQPPSDDRNSPEWQLFYNLLGIFTGVSHEIPEALEHGILAFEVEAGYADMPPGVIPDIDYGPLGGMFRQKLPIVIREQKDDFRTILDESTITRRMKIAVKFLRQSTTSDTNLEAIALLILKKQGPGGPVPLVDEKYLQFARQLQARSHNFRQQLAMELAPELNACIQKMPYATLEQKKEVARFVNESLECLGLAAECPKTGQPAKLRGATGNKVGVGTFYFEVYIDGKREKTSYSEELPQLTIIDATPPKEPEIEPESKWEQAVGNRSGRKGPRR